MRRLLIAAAVLTVAGCVSPPIVPVDVPLQYATEARHDEFPPPLPCQGMVSRIVVKDARPTPTIGVRHPQDEPRLNAPVHTIGNAAAWAGIGTEAILRQSGVVTRRGGPVLHLQIDRMSSDESTFYNAEYSGQITMSAELATAGGKSCWKESVQGSSQNYGSAGSPVNYMETLNHALDRAVLKMLASNDFRSAVCGCS